MGSHYGIGTLAMLYACFQQLATRTFFQHGKSHMLEQVQSIEQLQVDMHIEKSMDDLRSSANNILPRFPEYGINIDSVLQFLNGDLFRDLRICLTMKAM